MDRERKRAIGWRNRDWDRVDHPLAEHRRSADATGRAEDDLFGANPWYEWGPYLSERAWGTVREDYSDSGDAWSYFPHDHARSRAYRWNEDGMAGLSDIRHELCLSLALWNGVDPILKERMFGLTGPQGNHGEDVKEYWWYLDALPSHAWLRWRYHYPQAAFPYQQLIDENARRSRDDPEFELLDTGVFDEDRYWVVDVTYAKASPTEVLARITIENQGPEEAALSVLPTLWFRNTWRFSGDDAAAAASGRGGHRRRSPTASGYRLDAAPHRRGTPRGAVLRQRDQHRSALRSGSDHRLPQGRHQRSRGRGRRHGQSGPARARRRAGGTGSRSGRRPGRAAAAAAPARPGRSRPAAGSARHFDEVMAAREAEADEFYAAIAPDDTRPRAGCGYCARPAPGWSGASRSTRIG